MRSLVVSITWWVWLCHLQSESAWLSHLLNNFSLASHMRSRTKSRKWAILLSNNFLLSYVQYLRSSYWNSYKYTTNLSEPLTQRILLSHLHNKSFWATYTTNLTEPLKKRFLATYMVIAPLTWWVWVAVVDVPEWVWVEALPVRVRGGWWGGVPGITRVVRALFIEVSGVAAVLLLPAVRGVHVLIKDDPSSPE